MSKPAKRRKCPKCGKYRDRIWVDPPGLKFVGDGWYVTEARKEKFRKEGFDKSQAEEFYKENIESSKRRMKSGGQHYKPVMPDYKYMEEKGLVRKLNEKEQKEKKKRMRKLTQETYEKTGKKIERPKHPQKM